MDQELTVPGELARIKFNHVLRFTELQSAWNVVPPMIRESTGILASLFDPHLESLPESFESPEDEVTFAGLRRIAADHNGKVVSGILQGALLTFAHSVAEDTLHRCLKCSYRLAPAWWMRKWSKEHIPLKVALGSDSRRQAELFVRTRLDDYCTAGRFATKFNDLIGLCRSEGDRAAVDKELSYWKISDKDLKRADHHRNEVVHDVRSFRDLSVDEKHLLLFLNIGHLCCQALSSAFSIEVSEADMLSASEELGRFDIEEPTLIYRKA